MGDRNGGDWVLFWPQPQQDSEIKSGDDAQDDATLALAAGWVDRGINSEMGSLGTHNSAKELRVPMNSQIREEQSLSHPSGTLNSGLRQHPETQ